jgi:hypothetical protein
VLAEAIIGADPAITTATPVVRAVFAMFRYDSSHRGGTDNAPPDENKKTTENKKSAIDCIFKIC